MIDRYLAPNVPEVLAEDDSWVVFELTRRGDKLTKVPSVPWSDGSNHNESENQRPLDTVAEWCEMTQGYYKPGYVFNADGPFVGIDLDDCRDPETGEIDDEAQEIIDRLDSYTIVSTSGTGIHVYVRGELDGALKNDERGVEIYDRERFFSWTGDTLYDDEDGTVAERQDVIDWLMDEYMIEADEPPAHDDVDEYTEPTDTEGESDLFETRISDVYPGITLGSNIPHPVSGHGSSTGANFKANPDDERAICWRGEHRYGSKQGCGLNAAHLLAMEGTGRTRCDRVRRDWPTPELVFHAYVEGVQRGCVSASPPPWLAVKYISEEYDVGGLYNGGKGAWAAYRACIRIMRAEFDLPIELDDDGVPNGRKASA